MTDQLDQENELSEQHLQHALNTKAHQPRYTGLCHNCTEHIEAGAFCSPECREDWEQRQRFRGRL